MNAIDFLIGPFPAHVQGPPPGQPWVLRREGGVTLHLISDVSDERVMLGSAPGVLGDSSDLGPDPWQHTLPHPRCAEVACTLDVAPETGALRLVDVWPRHAVDRAAFEDLVEDHVRRHHRWRELIASGELQEMFDEAEQGEEGDEGDEDGHEDVDGMLSGDKPRDAL